jgi:hypothetical protein
LVQSYQGSPSDVEARILQGSKTCSPVGDSDQCEYLSVLQKSVAFSLECFQERGSRGADADPTKGCGRLPANRSALVGGCKLDERAERQRIAPKPGRARSN